MRHGSSVSLIGWEYFLSSFAVPISFAAVVATGPRYVLQMFEDFHDA